MKSYTITDSNVYKLPLGVTLVTRELSAEFSANNRFEYSNTYDEVSGPLLIKP